MIKLLFVFVFVCKIFEFGTESPSGCQGAINEWLKDKKAVVSQTQTSTPESMNIYPRTIITIIAEE